MLERGGEGVRRGVWEEGEGDREQGSETYEGKMCADKC